MVRPVAKVVVVGSAESAAETARRLERALTQLVTVTATSIPEAMALVTDHHVDCVVSDYEVPDETGLLLRGGEKLVRQLHEHDASLPFVLFTDVGNEAIARTALTAGMTDYIWRRDEQEAYDRLAERVHAAITSRWVEQRAAHFQNLNETMRLVHQAVTRASTPDAVDRAIVDTITETGLYRHAAVGVTDGGRFSPRAENDATTSFDWAFVPATEDEVTVLTATVLEDDGNLYVAAVPLRQATSDYGVLTLATTQRHAFSETERAVLAELGETVAHAIEAVETRQRLQLRERDLENQNERLAHFASAVSHDLRNPLQVAAGHLDLLATETDSESVTKMRASLTRMEALIDDVLALARQDGTRLSLEPVSLADVVHDAWDQLSTGAGVLTVDPDLGQIEADRSQLRRLLVNLFKNAVEHGTGRSHAPRSTVESTSPSPDSPVPRDPVGHDGTSVSSGSEESAAPTTPISVRLRWLENDGTVGFAVEDDGVGIPSADQERLFELGHTTGESNTGLGLAIVEEVAEAHSWSVAVGDSDLGGASFEITGVTPA